MSNPIRPESYIDLTEAGKDVPALSDYPDDPKLAPGIPRTKAQVASELAFANGGWENMPDEMLRQEGMTRLEFNEAAQDHFKRMGDIEAEYRFQSTVTEGYADPELPGRDSAA